MNGILIVDKPETWTSHDVIGKLRGVLHERRMGHGGTLDPMATGVLPVFIGRATRAVDYCQNAQKRYVARVRMGLCTDTQDITGRTLETSALRVSREAVEGILPSFTGEIDQIPPMYSAVKIGGVKLYKLARKGAEIDVPPRRITIHNISLLDFDGEEFTVDVTCSKGTYIRTLCHDIGKELGCLAALSGLRRVCAGSFSVSEAHTLEEIIAAADNGEIERYLLPVDSVFAQYPAVTVSAAAEQRIRCGAEFSVSASLQGQYRVYGEDGSFLMLGTAADGKMRTVKNFFEV